MAKAHMTRQKEYALQAADARRRWETTRQRELERRAYMSSNGSVGNTLGPQEDVVESRRFTRNRVVVTAPRSASTKNLLMENMILLVLLVASIYGLYQLSIYILNQS